ncbi:MAG: YqeG family HAD IIIA-type phosphatase [Ruminococcaceae bacterium]|nr:YqeG family HAD IIIA-type phosphatase [Oscillospiraceae bacterium]
MSSIFLPDIFAETVYDIDLDALKKEGIRGFVFDIDNTLVTYADPIATERVVNWLESLRKLGFKLYIVSNNDKERVRIFSESVNLPHYGKALKPLSRYLKKACRNMGITPGEAALVGDQLFTDIWGGNLLKMKTILVKPISEVEDGFVKFKRRFERRILRRMNR